MPFSPPLLEIVSYYPIFNAEAMSGMSLGWPERHTEDTNMPKRKT